MEKLKGIIEIVKQFDNKTLISNILALEVKGYDKRNSELFEILDMELQERLKEK